MSDNNTGVTVTLKAGVGFEAPWIVIHASDIPDALRQVDSGEFATLAERAVAAGGFLRAAHTGKQAFPAAQTSAQADPGPSWSQQGSQQAAQPQAPAQPGKHCQHGPMTFREGVGKNSGKPYKAYFCPTPQGTSNQCPPEFLKG